MEELLGLGFIAGLIFVVLAVGGWLPYKTGKEWYDTCWQAHNSESGKPKTPEEAADWKQCEPVAERALYEAGFIFSGNPDQATTKPLKAVAEACPSNYSDVPLGGINLLVLAQVEQMGGAGLTDRFMPANELIVRAMKQKWPNCPSVREAEGFPKIVMKNGRWDYQFECQPCKAEQAN